MNISYVNGIQGMSPFFIIEKPEMIDTENVSTTQRYLGKVSDVEALRWIENVYA